MSRENVEIVRAAIPSADTDIAALVRDQGLFEQGIAALASVIDPAFEATSVWAAGTTYRGPDGLREMWMDWVEPWASYHVGVEEFIDAGDRVVALIRDRGRRHDMANEVEIIAASVWELREGKIVRAEFFGTRGEALEAVGLSE
jgi:ketosteroid isomerase-like protein